MEEMLRRIVSGIEELFPEATGKNITSETRLGAIPDWDSMAAVNFQAFLEQAFQTAVPVDMLRDETTIAEVISFLETPAGMKVAV